MPVAVGTIAHVALRKLKPTVQAQEMRACCFFSDLFIINACATVLAPCDAEETPFTLCPPILHGPAILSRTVKHKCYIPTFRANINIEWATLTIVRERLPIAIEKRLWNSLLISFLKKRVEDIKMLSSYVPDTINLEPF